jgi:hypothetical protein
MTAALALGGRFKSRILVRIAKSRIGSRQCAPNVVALLARLLAHAAKNTPISLTNFRHRVISLDEIDGEGVSRNGAQFREHEKKWLAPVSKARFAQ